MVWQFFEALRRSVARAHNVDQRFLAQEVAVSVFLAVATVETFLNLFFRIVVEKGENTHKEQLLRDLSFPYLSLEMKIKRWPKNILGKSIERSAEKDDIEALTTPSRPSPSPEVVRRAVALSHGRQLTELNALLYSRQHRNRPLSRIRT